MIARLQSGFGGGGVRAHAFDPGDVVTGEGRPQGVEGRLRIDPFERHRLLPAAVVGPESIAHHVAMHATLHHLAIPIEFAAVLLRQLRKLHRSPVGGGPALFAGEGFLVGRIPLMQYQSGLQRFFEAGGGFVERVLLMLP